MRLENLPERIREKIFIEPNTGCWIWLGYCGTNGYGVICKTSGPKYVHRIVYEALVGQIPAILEIDHLCRCRCCCNPAHLEAVTPSENIRRSPIHYSRTLKAKTHCPHGHEYTTDNIMYRRGKRECRICNAIRAKQWRDAIKG